MHVVDEPAMSELEMLYADKKRKGSGREKEKGLGELESHIPNGTGPLNR